MRRAKKQPHAGAAFLWWMKKSGFQTLDSLQREREFLCIFQPKVWIKKYNLCIRKMEAISGLKHDKRMEVHPNAKRSA